jgi:putative ABC transport system ATP-binding protein
MTGAADRAVALCGVEKSFVTSAGRMRVLDGVELAIDRGEVVAVGGPSGSGKTTLLTLIGGFEQPDAGAIDVAGVDGALADAPWGAIALLPQSLGLLDELTIDENIALPLRLGRSPEATDRRELMEQLGIDHLADRFPNEVSLGEQQRAALARAAILRPAVLLADEPIAHQNDAWAETMLLVIQLLAAGGTACLIASHNELVFDVASRAFELHDGRLHPRVR